jgi:hypothetical protein
VVGGPCEVEGELWNEEKGVGGGKSDSDEKTVLTMAVSY